MSEEIQVHKQCWDCAYRGPGFPGNAHIGCRFDFNKANLPQPAGDQHGIRKGWYIFPVNFDPVWMIEKCEGHSTERNSDLIRSSEGGFSDLISMITGR